MKFNCKHIELQEESLIQNFLLLFFYSHTLPTLSIYLTAESFRQSIARHTITFVVVAARLLKQTFVVVRNHKFRKEIFVDTDERENKTQRINTNNENVLVLLLVRLRCAGL